MEVTLALVAVLALVALALLTMLARRRSHERSAQHDDLRRVGDEAPSTPGAAASRAEGEAAWMRPSDL